MFDSARLYSRWMRAPVVAASGGTEPSRQVIEGFVARRFGSDRFHRRPGALVGGTSAEGERERLHARIQKHDLELSVGNLPRLADQLMQPLLGHRAVAPGIDVAAVRVARCSSIEQHLKAD